MECSIYKNLSTGDIHPKVEMTGGEFLFVKKEIEKEGKAAIEKVCMAVAEEFIHLYAKALIEMCREEDACDTTGNEKGTCQARQTDP